MLKAINWVLQKAKEFDIHNEPIKAFNGKRFNRIGI